MECYQVCSSKGYFGVTWYSSSTCRCYFAGFGELSSYNWANSTTIETCSENNTFNSLTPVPDYPIKLIGDAIFNLNSSAFGDVFGQNRWGVFGSLCPTIDDGMNEAEVICNQLGFDSAIGYTQGSIFSYAADPYTDAVFGHSECQGNQIGTLSPSKLNSFSCQVMRTILLLIVPIAFCKFQIVKKKELE